MLASGLSLDEMHATTASRSYLPCLCFLPCLPTLNEQDVTPGGGDPAERREALFERDLKRLSTRTTPLGTDRWGIGLMYFSCQRATSGLLKYRHSHTFQQDSMAASSPVISAVSGTARRFGGWGQQHNVFPALLCLRNSHVSPFPGCLSSPLPPGLAACTGQYLTAAPWSL
jgi:hypothetical protein